MLKKKKRKKSKCQSYFSGLEFKLLNNLLIKLGFLGYIRFSSLYIYIHVCMYMHIGSNRIPMVLVQEPRTESNPVGY